MSATTVRPPAEGQEGFSLVEVLGSMMLLAFVLLTSANMLVVAARENTAARDQTVATTLAVDRAETLKRAPYATLNPGQDETRIRGMVYTRVWTIENDVPYARMRRVTVTVTPRRSNGHGGNRVATIQFNRVPS